MCLNALALLGSINVHVVEKLSGMIKNNIKLVLNSLNSIFSKNIKNFICG